MKKFFVTLFSISLFFLAQTLYAASLSTTFSSNEYRIGEEFTVPIFVVSDAAHPLNAFSIEVSYPKDILSFVGTDEASSIVPLWVEKPENDSSGRVVIEGAVPGGFVDVFDPLAQTHTSGLITTLIFKPIKAGSGAIETSNMHVYTNDGLATPIATTGFFSPFTISNEIATVPYLYKDAEEPLPFIISLEHNALMFNDNYFITFNALDKGSGIDHYEVSEGGVWQKTESPYVLKDQSLSSTIKVKAFDKAGNTKVATLAPLHSSTTPSWVTMLLAGFGFVVLVLLILILIRKKK
jgi:hypothetical protein